jgi:broad specificity phosphatase PhoE
VTPPLRLWLVRHGETAGQSSLRYHGSNDVPLSDEGRGQVRALVPLFANLQPVVVLHSPLVRASESAAILQQGNGWPGALLAADERLREISFGLCEGMTVQEIAAAFPDFWALHGAGRAPGFPGGEPRAAFVARVQAVFTDIVTRHRTGDVVVVAHRGTLRHGLRHLCGTDGTGKDNFGVDLASLTVVTGGTGFRVERLNVVPATSA